MKSTVLVAVVRSRLRVELMLLYVLKAGEQHKLSYAAHPSLFLRWSRTTAPQDGRALSPME